MHSSEDIDVFLPAAAIIELIEPRSKEYREYRSTHPIPPSFSFLDRILAGTSSPNQLLLALTSHVSRLNGREASIELDFLAEVFRLAAPKYADNKSKPFRHEETLRTIRLSESLWTHIFHLLRRAAKNEAVDARGGKNGDLIYMPVIGILANVIHDCQFNAPDEREALVALWLRTGLFDALDEAMPKMAGQTGMPSMYSFHIFSVFKTRLILMLQCNYYASSWASNGPLRNQDHLFGSRFALKCHDHDLYGHCLISVRRCLQMQ
jgi:hypothetical protein